MSLKLKELGSRFMESISEVGRDILEVGEAAAVLVGWNEAAEKCREGIEACEESRLKWKDRADQYQAQNVFGSLGPISTYKPDERQQEVEDISVSCLTRKLNGGKLDDVLRGHTREERLEFINDIANDLAQNLGVEMKEIHYYQGRPTSLGYFCRQDNSIHLNVAHVTCDNVYCVKQQIFTIFHETMHAVQWKAVEDFAHGGDGLGYSQERLMEWMENFTNYISPEMDYEAYRKQPLERDAFGLEWEIKERFNC